MKIKELLDLISKYDIPKDCDFLNDSGWECDATNINGLVYLPKLNKLIGYQYSPETLLNKVERAFIRRDKRDDDYPLWFHNLPANLDKEFSVASLDTLSKDDIVVLV